MGTIVPIMGTNVKRLSLKALQAVDLIRSALPEFDLNRSMIDHI
jgi:hypothetical protein